MNFYPAKRKGVLSEIKYDLITFLYTTDMLLNLILNIHLSTTERTFRKKTFAIKIYILTKK